VVDKAQLPPRRTGDVEVGVDNDVCGNWRELPSDVVDVLDVSGVSRRVLAGESKVCRVESGDDTGSALSSNPF
jgi:hypothetical protein